MTDESHQAITTMRAAFEFIEDLRDRIATLTAELEKAHGEGLRWMEYADELTDTVFAAEAEIATLTAQRDAAEKVCEAAEVVLNHYYDFDDNEDGLRAALTDWRRTKEGA